MNKLALLAPILLLLQACSNSAVIISPLYDRIDDRMRSAFAKSGDYTKSQSTEYSGMVANFHYWHRRSELPSYAALLDDIQSTIQTRGKTTRNDLARWTASSEKFTRSLRECHPINFSANLIRSLDDEQIDSIRTSWTERRTEHRKRYEKRTPEQRIDRRVKNITKWSSRIGFEFTKKQTVLLRNTFSQQISLRTEYFSLSDTWREEFFDLADQRESPELDSLMAQHLDKLWHLLESAHPQEWQQNRKLWADFGYQFIVSLTKEQRRFATIWLRKMGKTLLRISKERATVPEVADHVGCAKLDGA